MEVVSEALNSLEIVCSKFKNTTATSTTCLRRSKGRDAINYLKHSDDARAGQVCSWVAFQQENFISVVSNTF